MSAQEQNFSTGRMTLVGELKGTVTVLLQDASGKALLASGVTVPADTSTIYAKGCLFVDTDVASATSGLYVNVGTSSSSIFKLVTNAA